MYWSIIFSRMGLELGDLVCGRISQVRPKGLRVYCEQYQLWVNYFQSKEQMFVKNLHFRKKGSVNTLVYWLPCFTTFCDTDTISFYLIRILALLVPIPDEAKKLTLIFVFTLLCGASKSFMEALKSFMKPFEAP